MSTQTLKVRLVQLEAKASPVRRLPECKSDGSAMRLEWVHYFIQD